MKTASPELGSTALCAETGQPFTIARDGCSFNYATNAAGEIISDAGVDIRERRELVDRSRPFGCYVASDGKHVTGWKGNVLGTIVEQSSHRNNWGARIHCYRVRDVHGAHWQGRNAGPGMCIILRASKT